MPNKNEGTPPPQSNYATALALAEQKLAAMDFATQCKKAGVELASPGALVRFIDRTYLIESGALKMSAADNGAAPELWEQIIILHYLAAASGQKPTGELISYRQVPDGAAYSRVFHRRTSGILLSAFAERLPALMAAAEKLGAETVPGHGDSAFKVRALPRVEYLFVCYEADPEFPAEIKIFFDSSITSYLPAEDVTVLGQMICIKIVKQSG